MNGKTFDSKAQEPFVQGPEITSVWKFSVEQYHHMIANGTLSEDDPVELLEGWLVTKMPKDPNHSFSLEESAALLQEILPQGYYVKQQNPITIETSEPEPDICIIRGSKRDFVETNPTAKDIPLIIEVANSSLRQDRTLKQRIYAVAGIPVYWIINVVDRQLESYTNPLPNEKRYADQNNYDIDSLVPLIIDGKEIAQLAVKDLLP
jgi:Uma2 family endonuclease